MYQRVVLKVSGEYLGETGIGLSRPKIEAFAQQIVAIQKLGVALALVLGGGNIFRGHTYNHRNSGFKRTDADQMGMLATAINALALRSVLAQQGVSATIQSSIKIEGIAERFSVTNSETALRDGKVVLFCCGTGNPFFSTDSAAALHACELQADILLKATNVDGVYDYDPKLHPEAKKFNHLTYSEVLQLGLCVMDMTAFILCKENNIPIRVFNGHDEDSVVQAVQGQPIGTLIGE